MRTPDAFQIRVLPSHSDLLAAVKAPIPLDADRLQQAFLSRYGESVYGTLERTGFELQDRVQANLTPFATENAAALFVKFDMTFECVDLTPNGRTEGVLRLTGDCSCDPIEQEYSEIRNFGEHLQFRAVDGTLAESRNHVLFVDSAVMGHKVVTDVTRYPLGEQ